MKRGKKEEENALKLNKKCILLSQKSFKKTLKINSALLSHQISSFFVKSDFTEFSSTEEDVAN